MTRRSATYCFASTSHGMTELREFVHPKWRGFALALWCPVCRRAWFTLPRGSYVELDMTQWKELVT